MKFVLVLTIVASLTLLSLTAPLPFQEDDDVLADISPSAGDDVEDTENLVEALAHQSEPSVSAYLQESKDGGWGKGPRPTPPPGKCWPGETKWLDDDMGHGVYFCYPTSGPYFNRYPIYANSHHHVAQNF